MQPPPASIHLLTQVGIWLRSEPPAPAGALIVLQGLQSLNQDHAGIQNLYYEALGQMLNAGFAHHQAGRLGAAGRFYTLVLLCQPDHTAAIHLLGMTRRRQDAGLPAALPLLRRAARMKPDDTGILNNLSNALRDAGQPIEGAIVSRQWYLLAPNDANACASLVGHLLVMKAFANAADTNAWFVRLTPNQAPGYVAATMLLKYQKKWDAALLHIRRATVLSPHDGNVYFQHAETLHARKDFVGALCHYWRAILLGYTDDPISYAFKAVQSCVLAQALARHQKGDSAGAAPLYHTLVRYQPAAALPLARIMALADAGQPLTLPDHPVFDRFERTPEHYADGFAVNCLGARCRLELDWELNYFHPHELASGGTQIIVGAQLPIRPSEDYFEWIDLLTAIDEAEERFFLIELGAGYGRWLAHATAALRRRQGPPLAVRMIGVEADASRIQSLIRNLNDNGVKPEECRLLYAGITDFDGELRFPKSQGAADGGFGFSVTAGEAAGDSDDFIRVPGLRLATLLQDETGIVDLIDMDIQGEELKVLRDSIGILGERVRRLHVATHGRGLEEGIIALMAGHGWQLERSLICQSDIPQDTPFGPFYCNDGIQLWINPRLTRVCTE